MPAPWPPTQGTPLNTGNAFYASLYGYWPCWESSGSSAQNIGPEGTAIDLTGFSGTSWGSNADGPCLNMNGSSTSGAKVATTNYSLQRTNSWSIAMRITLNATSQQMIWTTISHADGNYSGVEIQETSSGAIQAQVCAVHSVNKALAETSAPVGTGSIHEIIWTYNGSSNTSGFKFYVDGASVSVSSLTNGLVSDVNVSNHLYIGARNALSSMRLNGAISHIRFWKDRVLNSTEVSSLYSDPGQLFQVASPPSSSSGASLLCGF